MATGMLKILMGLRLHGRGCHPQASNYLGSCRRESERETVTAVGRQGLTPSPRRSPSPWEAGILAGPLLYGVPMLSFLKKERAAFLGLQAYCLKILLPKSPVPPTGVPIWPSQVPLCQLCHRWSLPWKSPQFRLVPRREPTAFRLCHMLLVSPTQ